MKIDEIKEPLNGFLFYFDIHVPYYITSILNIIIKKFLTNTSGNNFFKGQNKELYYSIKTSLSKITAVNAETYQTIPHHRFTAYDTHNNDILLPFR